jgi:hypothetical protein
MFVDWVGVSGDTKENKGDIFIVTKGGCGGGVGKIPVAEHKNLKPAATSTAVYIMPAVVDNPPEQGSVVTCTNSPLRTWVGADMRRDGRLIAILRGSGNSPAVYFFPRLANESVAQALNHSACNYIAATSSGLANEKKHEAVAFVDPEGLRFADTSECEGGRSCNVPVYFYELEYADSNFVTIVEPLSGWQQITFDDFEDGTWGNYIAVAGGNAAVSNEIDTAGADTCQGNCACQGQWSAKIHDDGGSLSSFFHSSDYACDSYSLLRVTFSFRFRDYNHLDSFFIEISFDGGSNYSIVDSWSFDVDSLENAVCYPGHVLLTPAQFRRESFGDTVRLRFRNSGNSVNDRAYVDSILFEGQGLAPSTTPNILTSNEPSPSPFVGSSDTTLEPFLVSFGGTPPADKLPLGLCQGDCDNDDQCLPHLYCFQRDEGEAVPGCQGGLLDSSRQDYCIVRSPTSPPYFLPPPPAGTITYFPGNLTTFQNGLLLSEGLDSKELALTGNPVKYHNGQQSSIKFHGRPDGAATFSDDRPGNVGGWVYASNSEMPETGKGGVGALTFDKDGHLINYQMVLEQSTNNCGGGPTPWNTWISCEEVEGVGRIFQVDPFGKRPAQETTMGGPRGRYEAFAYDVRDTAKPRFFATEDREKGALTRFTPSTPDWNNKWDILHGPGVIDYLLLTPNRNEADIGTFTWATDRTLARNNAMNYYPFTEGIDTHENELFFVCKTLYMLYILNLDDGTYTRTTTKSGLFSSKPDQLQRIIGDPRGMLYFTEEGGLNSGVHARDEAGRFYTILESPVNPGETTGVAFSPNGMFLYVAYQQIGKLYTVWRRDGQPFQATRFDVKYHET